MIGRRTVAALVVCSAAVIALLWLTNLPLGVSGEWVWPRIPREGGFGADIIFGWVLAALAGAAYVAILAVCATQIAAASRWEAALWVFALIPLGFAWLWIVQESASENDRLQKYVYVLYYPGSSGYFTTARYDMQDVKSFLSSYETRMARGDVLHEGTHPPGLYLLERGLINLCGSSPGLVQTLNGLQPKSVRAMFDLIEANSRGTPHALLPQDRATIWLAALLVQLAAVAAVVPLYQLLRRTCSKEASWLACALWPLVPALAVFLPKSDALYPFLGLSFLALWLRACDRQSLISAALSGVVFWCGMMLSLAMLPVAALGAALTLFELWSGNSKNGDAPLSIKRVVIHAACSVGMFAVLSVALGWAFEINLASVWNWNFHNHAGFYAQNTRTYSLWLGVNLVEVILAVGPPIVLLAIAATGRAWQSRKLNGAAVLGLAGSCFLVWVLLWLSGKNMGEAARLWLILMPWPIWVGANYLPPVHPINGEQAIRRTIYRWLPFAICQLIVCIAMVTRVSGFPVVQ